MAGIDKPDIVVKACLEYGVQVTAMPDEDVLHGSGLKGFHTEFTTIYCLRHSDSSLHKGKLASILARAKLMHADMNQYEVESRP